jgi:DNA (cytosine-5)-methyltransferase 1
LQDFPDTAHNKAKESGVSDSQLYKQAGNSMSVNVLEMIFRQIEKAKNKEEHGGLF